MVSKTRRIPIKNGNIKRRAVKNSPLSLQNKKRKSKPFGSTYIVNGAADTPLSLRGFLARQQIEKVSIPTSRSSRELEIIFKPSGHQKKTTHKGCLFLVPLIGLEPIRYFYRGILSPLRLPIPPQRQIKTPYKLVQSSGGATRI